MSSFVELVKACEDALKAIQKEFPDVPPAVVVVGSGGRRAATLLGHFAPDRWVDDQSVIHEILIVAEQLHRGSKDVFCTLLHESVHGIANTRGIKDVSGRSHNKKFKMICEEVGMVPPEHRHKTLGWSEATLSESTEWLFRDEIKAIEDALNLCRVIITDKEKVKNSWKLTCSCDRSVRVGKKFFGFEPEADDPTDLICAHCNEDFKVED